MKWTLVGSALVFGACESTNKSEGDAGLDASLFDSTFDGSGRDGSNSDAGIDAFVRDARVRDPLPVEPARGLARIHDVSILYPMAPLAEIDAYVAADETGAKGVLLPHALFDAAFGGHRSCEDFPEDPELVGSECVRYDNLRVVALRIDPCFGQLDPHAPVGECRNQIRLIYQSVRDRLPDGRIQTLTSDGALHVFYELSSQELSQLAAQLVNLRIDEAEEGDAFNELGVHPILRRQGLRGDFSEGLHSLLHTYAGSANISRITLMENIAEFDWEFSGIEVQDGVATPLAIHGLGNSRKVKFIPGPTTAEGVIEPALSHDDQVTLLTHRRRLQEASAAEINAAMQASFRIENPRLHTADSVDCASCHIAQTGREYAILHRFGQASGNDAEAFSVDSDFVSQSQAQAPQFLTTSQDSLRNVHAFSYRFMNPRITQRVVNESADVVSYINRTVFAAE